MAKCCWPMTPRSVVDEKGAAACSTCTTQHYQNAVRTEHTNASGEKPTWKFGSFV